MASLRLHTFGGCWLETDGAPSHERSGQRQRLALLAIVAASGTAGVSRDRLLLLLWPESDEERARHSLNQSLYALRRDLGVPLVTGTSTLVLDPSLTADVAEFDADLRRGDLDAAIARYRGPFLDGFHLPDAPEFERWADEQRGRLAARARTALETLASQAIAAGNPAGAVVHRRRLAELEPLEPSVAIGLMEALAAAGDRFAALKHARQFQERLHAELHLPPDAAVEAAARAIGQAPVSAAPAAAAPDTATERAAPAPPEAVGAGPVASPAPSPAAAPRRRWWPAAAGAAALAVTLGVVVTRDRAPAAPVWVVLGALEATGDTTGVARPLQAALEAGVVEVPGVNVMPPTRVREVLARMQDSTARVPPDETRALEVAQREGAQFVLDGTLTPSGSGRLVALRLRAAATGAVVATARAEADDDEALLPALDDALAALQPKLRPRGAARPQPLPSVTTRSLPALRSYALGREAFNAGRMDEAREQWRTALAADSAFTAAHVALGGLFAWVNQPDSAERHFRQALGQLDRVAPRERQLVRARIAGWRGQRDSASAIFRAYLRDQPLDQAIWLQLAYQEMRRGQTAAALEAFDAARRLGPLDGADFVNIAATVLRRQPDSALAAYREAFARAPSLRADPIVNHEYGTAFVLAGFPDSARAVFEAQLVARPASRAGALRSLAWLALWEGRLGEAETLLRETITIAQAQGAPVTEARNRALLGDVLALRGLDAAALQQWREAAGLARGDRQPPAVVFLVARPLARSGEVAAARDLLALLEARATPGNAEQRAQGLALQAELLLAERRADEALEVARQAAVVDGSDLVRGTLASALAATGRLDEAHALYRELAATPAFGSERQLVAMEARYLAGRAAEQRADTAAAVADFREHARRWGAAEPPMVSVADARRRLAALRGADRDTPAAALRP